MNRGSLRLTINDAAHAELFKMQLPFDDQALNIKIELMDIDGDHITKEIPVVFKEKKQTTPVIDAARISHTQLGKQIAQRMQQANPTTNVFCAPLWKEIIGPDIETYYPCYARNLWQVFIINYQILTKNIEETIALIRKVNHATYCIRFIRAYWPILQSMFAEDPVLWLSRLQPSVFASYMHIVAKYYQAKEVSKEVALQFIRHTPVFLAVHRRQIPAGIFAACFKMDCKCNTCVAICTLPTSNIPAKKPVDPEQLPPVYNMDVFGQPVQRANQVSEFARALGGLGLLGMLSMQHR